MSNINDKERPSQDNQDNQDNQDIERDALYQALNNIERWTGFWQHGKIIIPLWMSKSGNMRMTKDEMKCLGAPIPSENDEQFYKEWCIKEGVEYLSPL